MKKLLKWSLVGVVALLIIFFLTLNLLARKSVEVAVAKVTGFPLEIGSMNVGLFSSKIDVRDIKLKNPSGYEDPVFANLPRLYVAYQLPSLVSGNNHIYDLLIELNEIVVVKKAGGESNVVKLKQAVSSGKGSTKYQIDLLRVRFAGDVLIKDYTRGKPTERRITLNLSRDYKDIANSTDVTRLVLMTILPHLPDIGIKPDELKKSLDEGVKGLGDTLDKAGKGIGDSLKQLIPGQNNK